MIKRVKELRPDVEIASSEFREFLEKFESEVNRGISTLCILSIIDQEGSKGTYAYNILKTLEEKTQSMLIVEEGTLYPLLRNLERDGLIDSRKETSGRRRKYYFMTENGQKIYNYLTGYYSKLTEAISPLIDFNVQLKSEKYYYCPMCANKIDLENLDIRYCDVCGHNIENDLEKRGLR